MSLFDQDGRRRERLEIAARYITKLESIVGNQRSERALLKALEAALVVGVQLSHEQRSELIELSTQSNAGEDE